MNPTTEFKLARARDAWERVLDRLLGGVEGQIFVWAVVLLPIIVALAFRHIGAALTGLALVFFAFLGGFGIGWPAGLGFYLLAWLAVGLMIARRRVEERRHRELLKAMSPAASEPKPL